jgi:hypothetical protein
VSKGFLIFAQNIEDCNYVEKAYALALSIKATQKEIKSVSIVTNNKLTAKQKKVFDNIIPIPWINKDIIETTFKAEHRWKLYHITPYKETMVLDADMIFLDDVSDWWKYCSRFDLRFCSQVLNYKLEPVKHDDIYRRAFTDNKLTNPYVACHYFKFSDNALAFYKTLEFVCNNWEWAYTKFAPVSYQNWLSLDLATAIAIEMSGLHETVIDVCCPLQFVHMKSGLQGWPVLPESWQDSVPYVLNSKNQLVVGNIRQPKLFHYVEKNFMSKKMITKLEGFARV